MSRIVEFWSNDETGKLNTLSFFRFWFDMLFIVLWVYMELQDPTTAWQPSSGIITILLGVNGLVPAATVLEKVGVAKANAKAKVQAVSADEK